MEAWLERRVRRIGAMEPKRNEYAISDLSRLYSLSLRTLRFYEDRDLLRPRREGMKRFYTDNDKARLQIILLAKRLGFSLAQIWELLEICGRAGDAKTDMPPTVETLKLSERQIRDQIDYLSRERARVDDAILELRQTAMRLDEAPHGEPAS